MARGSKPGERRGGRKRGTPNKKTALKDAVFLAATASLGSTPLDFMLRLMRDPNLSLDMRIEMAASAAPYVHSKPRKERVKPLDLTTRIESTCLKLSETEVEAELKSTELLNGPSTPLGFLAGVMNDGNATPQQRIKAAKILARYRQVPGRPDKFGSLIDDPFGFSCDLEVARDIRRCHLRLCKIRRRHSDGMPIGYTSGEIQEAEIIRVRMALNKAGLKRCPSYTREALLRDKHRLDELAAKQRQDVLTPEEESEEAYLFARVESYIETEEETAKRTYEEIRTRRSFDDKISPVEEKEFADIERRYPDWNPHNRPYLKLDTNDNLGSAASMKITEIIRYLADQQLQVSKKARKDDRSAVKEVNENAVAKERVPSIDRAAAVMSGKDDATHAVKSSIVPTPGEVELPEDFKEFLD